MQHTTCKHAAYRSQSTQHACGVSRARACTFSQSCLSSCSSISAVVAATCRARARAQQTRVVTAIAHVPGLSGKAALGRQAYGVRQLVVDRQLAVHCKWESALSGGMGRTVSANSSTTGSLPCIARSFFEKWLRSSASSPARAASPSARTSSPQPGLSVPNRGPTLSNVSRKFLGASTRALELGADAHVHHLRNLEQL